MIWLDLVLLIFVTFCDEVGLEVCAKNKYSVSCSPGLIMEPFERTMLVVVGLIDGDVDQNLEENSLEVAEKITNLNFIMGREFNQTNRIRQEQDMKVARSDFSRIRKMEIGKQGEGKYRYEWEVLDMHETERGMFLQINETGFYDLTVREFDRKTGEMTRESQIQIYVKYVRRSFFSLTEGDRSKFLRAMKEVYATPTDEGQEKFGDGFRNMQELWAIHNILAVDEEHQLLLPAPDKEPTQKSLEEMLERAKTNAKNNHGYRKKVSPPEYEKIVMMEIDGDFNQYDDVDAIIDTSDPEANALMKSNIQKEDLLQRAQDHGLLVSTGHGNLHTITNFGSFALFLETAVQSVDPSVSVPYYDVEEDRLAGEYYTSQWTEKIEIPEVEESDSRELVTTGTRTVEVEGTFAYIPVMTGENRQAKSRDGRPVLIKKGFNLPLMMKTPDGFKMGNKAPKMAGEKGLKSEL